MIRLNEIEAVPLVQLVDQRGNTASGTVLLDATRGRLCASAPSGSAALCRGDRRRLVASRRRCGGRQPHRLPAAGGRVMPEPGPVIGHGQTVALIMTAAGDALLVLALHSRVDPDWEE
jgi:hypothetical protein